MLVAKYALLAKLTIRLMMEGAGKSMRGLAEGYLSPSIFSCPAGSQRFVTWLKH